jgi:hypothetical protein
MKRVEATPERFTSVTCDQRRDAVVPLAHQSRLTARATPSDAEVFLDGEHHLGGTVPIGPHDLTVWRDGFQAHRQSILISANRDTAFEIQLRPTRAQQLRQIEATRQRRALGIVLAGSGLGVASSSATIFAWNAKRYEDWQADGRSKNELSMVASIQRADDVALATGVLATGLVVSSVSGAPTPFLKVSAAEPIVAG